MQVNKNIPYLVLKNTMFLFLLQLNKPFEELKGNIFFNLHLFKEVRENSSSDYMGLCNYE